MSKALIKTEWAFILSLVVLSVFAIPANAMSKSEAIEECLTELKIPKEKAMRCKSSDWTDEGCAGLKSTIRGCVKPKLFN